MNIEYSNEAPSRWNAAIESAGPGILCALAGFSSAFTVSVIGQMPVGELLLLAVFPWVLIRFIVKRSWPSRLQQLGWFKLILILSACMMMGYVISDLYRNTSFNNLARGWARVGFLAIDLVVIAYLIDNSWKRFYIFILALYLGYAANAAVRGPLYNDWWQFGVGYTLTFLAVFFSAGRSTVFQSVLLIGMGALSLWFGARSLGGICLLTAGLFGLRYAVGFMRPFAICLSLAATAVLFWAANMIFMETQNHRGSNTERQSMLETAGEAFIGSPFIGQGSWFTAGNFINRLEDRRNLIDPSFKGYSAEELQGLSIHSQLLVALAEGGLPGGAFFIGMAALLLKTIRTLVRDGVPHRAFILLVVILALWNLFMSPFSGVARIEIVLAVCACFLVILQRQGELEDSYRE